MLIDTLGPEIVNAEDGKNRWDSRSQTILTGGKRCDSDRTGSLCGFCRTPLHAAAFTDHVECLQLLLSHNAQVDSVDAAGKTPLMMAAENGQTNAVGTESSAVIVDGKTVSDTHTCHFVLRAAGEQRKS